MELKIELDGWVFTINIEAYEPYREATWDEPEQPETLHYEVEDWDSLCAPEDHRDWEDLIFSPEMDELVMSEYKAQLDSTIDNTNLLG